MKQLFQTMTLILLLAGPLLYSCKKETCEDCETDQSTSNSKKPPIAFAGIDQTVTLPTDSVLLDGDASKDQDGRIIAWQWTKVSGPSSFIMVDHARSKSWVTNLEAGVYVIELKVTDNDGLFAKDSIQITVLPPIFDPGNNQVFIAGWVVNANGKKVARVWKNNVLKSLSNGVHDGGATSVFASGSDVYVAGFDGYDATIWKNGIAQRLYAGGQIPDGISEGIATSVFVSGNDIYVSGNISNWVQLGVWVEGVLWKNGVVQHLDSLGSDYWANSVFVSNTDVYVAGLIFDFQANYHATIWKNGVAQFLTNGQYGETANSVFVTGVNVYVAGLSGNAGIVWKNGQGNSLGPGIANSIFVYGNDVYAAGEVAGVATLWKNGQATSLGIGSANSIFVYDNDVYIVGKKDGVATLWKNGIAYTLAGLTVANSVYVQ